MMRTPPFRASSSNWRSSSAPCGPSSLKPAEMTMAPLTPASRAIPDDAGDDLRGSDDHRQVHLGRDRADARIGLDARARWAA